MRYFRYPNHIVARCGRIPCTGRTAPRFHLQPATGGATRRQDCARISGIWSGWWAWFWFSCLHHPQSWSHFPCASFGSSSGRLLQYYEYTRISGTWADPQKRSSSSYIQDRTSQFHAWAKKINPFVRDCGFRRFFWHKDNFHSIRNVHFFKIVTIRRDLSFRILFLFRSE